MRLPVTARPHGTAASVGAVSVGEAVLEAASGGFAGRVEGTFAHGFYVSDRSRDLFVVLGPGSWAGPLHLIVQSLPARPALHERVSVSDGVLVAGSLRVPVEGCSRWAPRLPDRLPLGSRVWDGIGGIGGDLDLSGAWGAVTEDVGRGDLAAAFGRLQGRGCGLTPVGDDVLAGILLVAAIDPRRRGALGDLARSARTTRLSRAFLGWAAAGQSIEPAHDLLDAAAAGHRREMHRAARRLASVGATSGRALTAGVALAAAHLPPTMAPRPDAAQPRL